MHHYCGGSAHRLGLRNSWCQSLSTLKGKLTGTSFFLCRVFHHRVLGWAFTRSGVMSPLMQVQTLASGRPVLIAARVHPACPRFMPVDGVRTLGSALPQQPTDFLRVLLTHALEVPPLHSSTSTVSRQQHYWWAVADAHEDVY